jgi:hypothetical protein
MNIFAYKDNRGLLKKYIELNGIKNAFVWKEGNRHYQVLVGDSETQIGFVDFESKTFREAKKKCFKANELIKSAK